MANRDDEFQDDVADSDDRDNPDSSDTDDDDLDMVPCPYCRKQILEELELCPHCRNFISFEDAPRHHPRWLIAGIVVCIVIVAVWVVTNA